MGVADVLQVHGAAEAALAAAAASVRSELAAASPPPEKVRQEVPSLQLGEDLLSVARRLTNVAASSLERCQLYSSDLTALQVTDPPCCLWCFFCKILLRCNESTHGDLAQHHIGAPASLSTC